jgi:hypothetical protein
MSKAEVKTTVFDDGLRYKAKMAGSQFRTSASFSGATMSCFMCGKHRVRSQLRSRHLFGKSQTVCAPSCKALDELIASVG